MSSIIKRIDMRLESGSIEKAIQEVKKFQKELEDGMNDLIRQLTETGQQVARIQVVMMDAVYSGDLESNIDGIYNPDSHVGIIRAGVPYAFFVEFGTGYVGATSAQHPWHSEVGWEHDVHDHGPEGWMYAKNGHWFRTRGQPARPFMYNTMRTLESIAETQGADIILKHVEA